MSRPDSNLKFTLENITMKFFAADIDGKAIIMGHKETREDGRTIVVFDELQLKLKMKNYQIHLENLFNGDKRLGKTKLRVIVRSSTTLKFMRRF